MKFTKLILVLLLSLPFLASGKTLPLEQSKAKVRFLAIGNPSALRIVGKADDEKSLKGSLVLDNSLLKGDVSFPLEKLDTGIKTRNEHMKEKYLEVSKFPNATFTLNNLSIPVSGSGEKLPFEGILFLHGVKKPIKGNVDVKTNENSINAKFDFSLKVADYSIAVPSFMGITMANDVAITVEIEGGFSP